MKSHARCASRQGTLRCALDMGHKGMCWSPAGLHWMGDPIAISRPPVAEIRRVAAWLEETWRADRNRHAASDVDVAESFDCALTVLRETLERA